MTRNFLKIIPLLVLFLLGTAVWGKGGSEPVTEPEAEPEAAAMAAGGGYNEVPILADRVASGELPPVEERLPIKPKVGAVAKPK